MKQFFSFKKLKKFFKLQSAKPIPGTHSTDTVPRNEQQVATTTVGSILSLHSCPLKSQSPKPVQAVSSTDAVPKNDEQVSTPTVRSIYLFIATSLN
jgi:hypothetical protein